MKTKVAIVVTLLLLMLAGGSVVLAEDGGYPWQDHAPPYDFLFGNMIDSHQQSRINPLGALRGMIYIHYTGEFTDEGYPIARKAHCNREECDVGWSVKGLELDAELVCLSPRTWLVDPAALPRQRGFTHFHWLGDPYSPHGQGDPEAGLIVGETYHGYLMRRVARDTFWWTGGEKSSNPGHLVTPGIDPHSNIVLPGEELNCSAHGGGHDDDGGCGGDDHGSCEGGHGAARN